MLSPYITNGLTKESDFKNSVASIKDSKKGIEDTKANNIDSTNGPNAMNGKNNNIVSKSNTTTVNTLPITNSNDNKMTNHMYSPNSLLPMQDATMKPAPQVIQSDDGDAAIALEEVSFIYPQVPSFIAEVSVCTITDTDHASNTVLDSHDYNTHNEINKGEVTGILNSSLVDHVDSAAAAAAAVVTVKDKCNCEGINDEQQKDKFNMHNNDIQVNENYNNLNSPTQHRRFNETNKVPYSPPIRGIHKMSVSAMPHKITALFGHSGCGKSTCLRLFSGLVTPQSGVVRTHKHVVLLEQSHAIFIGSVAENILLENLHMPDSDTEHKKNSTSNNNNINDKDTICKRKHDAKDRTSSINNTSSNSSNNNNNNIKEKRK